MRSLTFFGTFVISAAFLFTASALAQGIGTTEYYIEYGRGYLDARQYDMAIMYFKDAIQKEPDNAEANYLMGLSYTKLGKADKAQPYFDKAVRMDSSYRQKLPSVPLQTVEPATPSSDREYEVGDQVEVFYAGQWNRGKVISVEGRGESVRAEVEYSFQGDARTAKFWYNALRHASRASASTVAAAAGRSGDGLTLGEYGCSSKVRNGSQWTFTPRGSFRLMPNGTYTQTSGGGKYKYEAAAKTISFIGGYFGNSQAIGKVVSSSQVDISFSDSYWWTCALQKD